MAATHVQPEPTLHLAETFIETSQSWSGFSVTLTKAGPGHIPVHLGKHHLLVNLGPSFQLRRDQYTSEGSLCAPGSVIQLSSGEHVSSIATGTAFQAIHISIDAEYVNRILDCPHFRFRPVVNTIDPFIQSIATKLRNILVSHHTEDRIYGESLIIALIIHLSHDYPGAGREHFLPKGRLRASQLREVIDFTRSCMHYNVGLEELASLVHLSPYHFGRLFKQTVGLSPYQFVLQQKIEYAKGLMKSKSSPIGDIAYQLNFSDQAHFSNAFRKATGVSPREFMRRAS